MTVFLTGGTGYLGGYVIDDLLKETPEDLVLLVRAEDRSKAVDKLWRGLQMHRSPEAFEAALERITFAHGDLHAPGLGLSAEAKERIVGSVDSVLHIAASLNRKSDKACFNTNLRGTLSVIQLAQAIRAQRPLRRFSYVSTVAVAGQRESEVIREDTAVDWNRSDYDPYGRTKKFTEHMVGELLADVPTTIFRPSIVMGDSRHPETTQFDMVRAVAVLADLRVVPLRPESQIDIVNADYVGKAIARIHQMEAPAHGIYHLSGGTASCTVREIAESLATYFGRAAYRFAPALEKPFGWAFDGMNALPGKNAVTLTGALMKVFWPYVTYNTVFDNRRVAEALGEEPAPFTDYGGPLLERARRDGFRYPYRPLPPAQHQRLSQSAARA